MVTAASTSPPLLQIRDLRVLFSYAGGTLNAVNGVSLDLWPGETLGIVGESGCGKSLSALALLGLVPSPGRVTATQMRFDNFDLAKLSEREWTSVRGNRIAMIFQEPATSLNPVFTIGDQIAEAVRLHHDVSGAAAWERAVHLLDRVGIPAPHDRAKAYPHQLSGGMRQRAMIAQALASRPDVLIADEPTTALDVTVQAQILNLILDLQAELGMAVVFISHDFAVVSQVADRIAVMYAGRIVEVAPAEELFRAALHPYTQALINTSPPNPKQLSTGQPAVRPGAPLPIIPGSVPALDTVLAGCPFAPRCPLADGQCHEAVPPLNASADDHLVACWKVTP